MFLILKSGNGNLLINGRIIKGNVTKSNSNVTNKSGAPPGNKNVKGTKEVLLKVIRTLLKLANTKQYLPICYLDEEKDIYSNLNDDPFYFE